jgi:hypothetical protein
MPGGIAVDQINSNNGSVSPGTPGSITTTAAKEIVAAVIATTGAITTPSSYT